MLGNLKSNFFPFKSTCYYLGLKLNQSVLIPLGKPQELLGIAVCIPMGELREIWKLFPPVTMPRRKPPRQNQLLLVGIPSPHHLIVGLTNTSIGCVPMILRASIWTQTARPFSAHQMLVHVVQTAQRTLVQRTYLAIYSGLIGTIHNYYYWKEAYLSCHIQVEKQMLVIVLD